MAANSIEARVIEFVALMAEVEPDRVTLSARLLDDLGIDGDDAVDLFREIRDGPDTSL
jgi:acyl carrier protein